MSRSIRHHYRPGLDRAIAGALVWLAVTAVTILCLIWMLTPENCSTPITADYFVFRY